MRDAHESQAASHGESSSGDDSNARVAESHAAFAGAPADPAHSQDTVPTARGDGGWRGVLSGMGPREALARLVAGDPLELRRVVAERLAARAYLFEADRVHVRALAHCARAAQRYRGQPPLAQWLADRVDQALADLLREDAAAESRAAPLDVEHSPTLVDLARPLGLDPASMRRVCVAHNQLPERERRAFHGLVIVGRALEEVARAEGTSGVEVARRARRGLEAVLIASGVPARRADAPAETGASSTCAASPAHAPQANPASLPEPGADAPTKASRPAHEPGD